MKAVAAAVHDVDRPVALAGFLTGQGSYCSVVKLLRDLFSVPLGIGTIHDLA